MSQGNKIAILDFDPTGLDLNDPVVALAFIKSITLEDGTKFDFVFEIESASKKPIECATDTEIVNFATFLSCVVSLGRAMSINNGLLNDETNKIIH